MLARIAPRSSSVIPALLVALAFLAAPAAVRAQAGGHKHVAEEVTTGPTGSNLAGRESPLLNKEDGRWNRGEALSSDPSPSTWLEEGGVLGPDSGPSKAIHHVNDLRKNEPSGGGWQTIPGTSLQNFIGELRPDDEALADEPSGESASFEIVAPDITFPDSQRPYTVVVLSNLPTFTSVVGTNRAFDPYVYPGNPQFYGLFGNPNITGPVPGNNRTWPWADVVVSQFEPQTSLDYHVVGAYIVPPIAFRPATFQVQRLRQLRYVVRDKLSGLGIDPTKVAFLVAGGSFGGFVSQAALQLYPSEFHAGLSSGWNAASAASRTTRMLTHSSSRGSVAASPGCTPSATPPNGRSSTGPRTPTSRACRW